MIPTKTTATTTDVLAHRQLLRIRDAVRALRARGLVVVAFPGAGIGAYEPDHAAPVAWVELAVYEDKEVSE